MSRDINFRSYLLTLPLSLIGGLVTAYACTVTLDGNIELDMKALLPTVLDKTPKEIELSLEMLVRAYDPCISCSTHCVSVHFV